APMEEAKAREAIALVPEAFDLVEDVSGHAVGEVDQVVHLQVAVLEMGVAAVIDEAAVGPRRQFLNGAAARTEFAPSLDGPLHARMIAHLENHGGSSWR